MIEPAKSVQHDGYAFFPARKLSGNRVSIRIRHTDGSTSWTYDGVIDMNDPGPVEWHHSFTSVYGNVRGGSGPLPFNAQDLSDTLDEVAAEATEDLV